MLDRWITAVFAEQMDSSITGLMDGNIAGQMDYNTTGLMDESMKGDGFSTTLLEAGSQYEIPLLGADQ